MNTKNIMLAIWNQLTRKGAWRNIFVTHNAFGIFGQYSHSPEEVVSLRWHIHQSMLRKRLQKQWERNMAFISLSINAHGVTDGI